MNRIPIEKGIPIPSKSHFKMKWKSTIDALQVGDSFCVKHERERQTIINNYNNYRIPGLSLVSRRIESGEYRIWRTK